MQARTQPASATRRNMRREERVTVQGPVKKQQPDGMSHRGVKAHYFWWSSQHLYNFLVTAVSHLDKQEYPPFSPVFSASILFSYCPPNKQH